MIGDVIWFYSWWRFSCASQTKTYKRHKWYHLTSKEVCPVHFSHETYNDCQIHSKREHTKARTAIDKQGRAHKWCTPMDPTYGRAKAGRPARTYIQELCEDTGCSPEDQPDSMNDREKWRERIRDIRASGTTWWWWITPNWRWLECSPMAWETWIQS